MKKTIKYGVGVLLGLHLMFAAWAPVVAQTAENFNYKTYLDAFYYEDHGKIWRVYVGVDDSGKLFVQQGYKEKDDSNIFAWHEIQTSEQFNLEEPKNRNLATSYISEKGVFQQWLKNNFSMDQLKVALEKMEQKSTFPYLMVVLQITDFVIYQGDQITSEEKGQSYQSWIKRLNTFYKNAQVSQSKNCSYFQSIINVKSNIKETSGQPKALNLIELPAAREINLCDAFKQRYTHLQYLVSGN